MTSALADDVLSPLCEAFADYPVMRYVLGPDGDYRERLRTLVRFSSSRGCSGRTPSWPSTPARR